MKKQQLKEGQVIIVHWLDQSYYAGPVEPGDVIQKAVGRDVGFFLEENSEWLTIGTERFTTDRICYRHIMTFPKVAITKIEIIKKYLK